MIKVALTLQTEMRNEMSFPGKSSVNSVPLTRGHTHFWEGKEAKCFTYVNGPADLQSKTLSNNRLRASKLMLDLKFWVNLHQEHYKFELNIFLFSVTYFLSSLVFRILFFSRLFTCSPCPKPFPSFSQAEWTASFTLVPKLGLLPCSCLCGCWGSHVCIK